MQKTFNFVLRDRVDDSSGMSCCEDPACSHALLTAATKEAAMLTDKEREIILGVLARDERLQRDQYYRIL